MVSASGNPASANTTTGEKCSAARTGPQKQSREAQNKDAKIGLIGFMVTFMIGEPGKEKLGQSEALALSLSITNRFLSPE